jgi:hypothetical protein
MYDRSGPQLHNLIPKKHVKYDRGNRIESGYFQRILKINSTCGATERC